MKSIEISVSPFGLVINFQADVPNYHPPKKVSRVIRLLFDILRPRWVRTIENIAGASGTFKAKCKFHSSIEWENSDGNKYWKNCKKLFLRILSQILLLSYSWFQNYSKNSKFLIQTSMTSLQRTASSSRRSPCIISYNLVMGISWGDSLDGWSKWQTRKELF